MSYRHNFVVFFFLQDFIGVQERIYDELTKPPSPRFTTLEVTLS